MLWILGALIGAAIVFKIGYEFGYVDGEGKTATQRQSIP
jgi:hypothetical protein